MSKELTGILQGLVPALLAFVSALFVAKWGQFKQNVSIEGSMRDLFDRIDTLETRLQETSKALEEARYDAIHWKQEAERYMLDIESVVKQLQRVSGELVEAHNRTNTLEERLERLHNANFGPNPV